MIENTAATKIIARLEVIAGKTMLPGEPGFVLDNLRTRTRELIAQWRALGVEGPHGHLRTEGTALWQFAQSVYENAHRYADHIVDTLADVDGAHRQPAVAAGEFVASVYSGLQHLQEAFANAGSIPEHHFEHIMSYLDMAAERLTYTDSAVLSLLESLKSLRGQIPAAAGEDDRGDDTSTDEPTERSIPRPPKTGSSRKRPCRKQGGRKQERRETSGSGRGPKERKLNQYALDPISGHISRVHPGQEIAKGSRVIEQPAGKTKPSIGAFYDATLLPAGSTLVARWGYEPAELDAQLVGRAGRLARIAGYGDQARSTMFDQIRRSANPTVALEALILELGGAEALTAEPGTLTTTVSRDAMAEAVLRAVNAGNEKLVELAENLPARLAPEKRLVDALADLPGMVESLEEDGNGSILRIRGIRFEDKGVICEKLRAAGGRHVDVQNTRIEKDGRSVKAYIVSARFDVAAVEVAAARTGRNAEVSYRVSEDGSVYAEYGVDLYGTRVTTPSIPCEPSWAVSEKLVEHLLEIGEPGLTDMVERFSLQYENPLESIAASLGVVRTVEQARQALANIVVSDYVTDEFVESLESAPREVRARDGRRLPVEYQGGTANIGEFSFHPTDLRITMLPEEISVGAETFPSRVRRVRFETKKGSTRLKVVVEDVDVTDLRERRESYLAGRDPRAALAVEVRENFIAEAARSMTATIVNPPESLQTARNPDAVAKSRVLSKHLDPYAAAGGDIVHLVEVLAAGQADAAWSRWCRDYVKAFRDDARSRRQQKQDPAPDFFAGAGVNSSDRNLLILAGAALLSEKLGRDVSTDEFLEIAAEVRVTKEHAYTAVDRGKALAQYVKRGMRSTQAN